MPTQAKTGCRRGSGGVQPAGALVAAHFGHIKHRVRQVLEARPRLASKSLTLRMILSSRGTCDEVAVRAEILLFIQPCGVDARELLNEGRERFGHRGITGADGVLGLPGAHSDDILVLIWRGVAWRAFRDAIEVCVPNQPLKQLGLIIRQSAQVQIKLDRVSLEATGAFKVDCGHGYYLTFRVWLSRIVHGTCCEELDPRGSCASF